MKVEDIRAELDRRYEGEVAPGAGDVPTIGSGFEPPARLVQESEFHWFHPPIGGDLILAVLSAEPLWYAGHFTQGRMRPCDGARCEACVLGTGRQIRYVVCAVDLRSRMVGFLEVGSALGEQLKNRAYEYGTLQGCVMVLSRASKKKNARLEMELLREEPPKWAMDIVPLSIQNAMAQTWARARRGGRL